MIHLLFSMYFSIVQTNHLKKAYEFGLNIYRN